MLNTTVSELKKFSKQELLEHIEKIQALNDKPLCLEANCITRHELEVHQIELEMQNRELREAQQQLEETRDCYADLYDFAPVNYISLDEDGIIKNINLTGASMLGEVRSNIVERPFSKWICKYDLEVFTNHLNEALKSNKKLTAEVSMKNGSGDILEVMIESIGSQDLGTNKLVCRSVIFDVTEYNRKKNELFLQARQLKLITDSLPVLIAYLDAGEKHLFANKTYVDSFDLLPNDIIDKTAEEIWGHNNYKIGSNYLKLSLAGQMVKFDMELPIGDERTKYFHTTLIPDYDNDSIVYGVIVLIGDVTDRLAIEAIDRKRLLDIAHFSRLSAMGEMASEIAHELNQPLAAISIYSDACRRMVLSGKSESEDIIQSLTDISVQADRAGAVIRRIREFVSKKDIQRNDTSINELVQGALQLLAVEIRSHNVELILDFTEDLPVVFVDQILIEQVIFNLIRNALEAMDDIEQHRRVLRIHTLVSQSNVIEVLIDDSGPGMTEEQLKKIFDPFQTTKSDGMGMGLAISFSIIEAHHGRLWCVPNNHSGTTFSFTLPTN